MKIAGIPITQWIEKTSGALTGPVTRWMQSLVDSVNSTTQQVATVSDSDQHATIAPTAFPASATLPGGLYRVTYAMWITTVGSVSSDLTFTVSWTNNLQTFSQSGALMNGNTLTTQQNGSFTFSIDASSSVTYGIVYNSNAANTMRFAYTTNLESVP